MALAFIASSISRLTLKRQVSRSLSIQPGVLAVVTMAICLISPSLLVVHIVFFILPFFYRANLGVLGSAYIAAVLLSPDVHDHFSFAGIAGFNYSVQMSLSLGVAFAALTVRRDPYHLRLTAVVPATILPLLMFAVGVRGTEGSNWLRELMSVGLGFLVPIVLMSYLSRTRENIEKLLISLGVVGNVLAVIALFEAFRNWPLYAIVNGRLGIYHPGLVVKMRDGLLRSYGPLADQTDLGFVLVICLAATLSSRRWFRSNFGYIGCSVIICGGIFATQSRGAMLGAVFSIILVPVVRQGIASSFKYLGAIAGGILSYWVAALLGFTYSASLDAQNTAEYRSKLLYRGIEEFWVSPVFGDTLNGVLGRMVDMRQGEGIVDLVNSYLYFALLTGGTGLSLFVIFLVWPIIVAARAAMRSNPLSFQRDLAAFYFAVFTASAAMYAFTSLIPRATILVLIVFIIGSRVNYSDRALPGKHH